MAPIDRLRLDGVENYLASQLDSGVTLINFTKRLEHDGGVGVPTLTADQYLPMSILDENYVLKEIVWLTSYTADTTSGIIMRGQEGTGDLQHAKGVKVVHAPTAEDFLSVLAHDQNPDAHKDLIIQIATDIAQQIMAAHLAAANPHPQYMLKDGGTFTGDVTINNLTVTGTLTIPEGASLDIYGTLRIMAPTGKIFIHGKQLIISNTEPTSPPSNTVWIQTFGTDPV